jgi:hypothetical protein
MVFDYRDGVERKLNKAWLWAPLLIALVGSYLLIDFFAPSITIFEDASATAKTLMAQQPSSSVDKLYLPTLNINLDIKKEDDLEGALSSEKSGTPKQGGNYTLSAHSFHFTLLPSKTKSQSPFYHLDTLEEGAPLYVDYQGTRYAYKVSAKQTVADTSLLNQKTGDTHLTLYSLDGRSHTVITATLTGTIVWTDGKAKLDAS